MTWKKGESGNPRGAEVGARRKLSEGFLTGLQDVWKEKGRTALDKVADEDPATFIRVIASLQPREVKLEHSLAEEFAQLTTEQIEQRIADLRAKRLALVGPGAGSAGTSTGGVATPPDTKH